LGGTYPVIFRNGNTNYKEFSISGLISYLQDPNNLFQFTEWETKKSTDLTYDNIGKEQKFKNEVL
jgi:hypothetical protein